MNNNVFESQSLFHPTTADHGGEMSVFYMYVFKGWFDVFVPAVSALVRFEERTTWIPHELGVAHEFGFEFGVTHEVGVEFGITREFGVKFGVAHKFCIKFGVAREIILAKILTVWSWHAKQHTFVTLFQWNVKSQLFMKF